MPAKFLVKDKKNHGKTLNRDTSPARDSKPGPPENVQYCTHRDNVRSVAVANFRVPKECFLQFNETLMPPSHTETEVWLHSFSTSAADGGEWSASVALL